MSRGRALTAALALLAGCQRGVDLTPPIAAGQAGTVDYAVIRTVRVVLNDAGAEARVEGTHRLEFVDGGAFGEDALTVREQGQALALGRDRGRALGWVRWSSGSGDEPPDELAGYAPLVGLDRTARFAPGAPGEGPAIAGYLEFEGLAETWFDALTHAPTGRVDVGATWSRPLPADDAGVPWFRTWTVLSIADGLATVESIDRPDDPLTGDPGPVDQQARTRVELDVRTGLPRSLISRDQRRKVLVGDVRATFDWE